MPFFANHDTTRFAGMPGATAAKLKLAFGLILTLRGIPEFYYGDEIAMSGGGDPDNRRDFPGGWHDDAKNAFTLEGRTPEQQDVFEFVQTLLALRRGHDALRSGQLWHLAADDSCYVFVRESEEERLAVTFNNAPTEKVLKLSLRDTPAENSAEISVLFGNARGEVGGKGTAIDTSAAEHFHHSIALKVRPSSNYCSAICAFQSLTASGTGNVTTCWESSYFHPFTSCSPTRTLFGFDTTP